MFLAFNSNLILNNIFLYISELECLCIYKVKSKSFSIYKPIFKIFR